jgi:hypothetical protein
MPTNKDNKDFDDVNGGFEFEPVPTWDNVEEEKSGAAEKSDFETDFSNLEFGGAADTDGDADGDNGFGFNFDAMPTEQSVTSDHHRGDPSSEFEEFGISQDEFSSNDAHETGFRNSDHGAPHAASPEEASQFDEFDQAFSTGADDHVHHASSDTYYDDATDALTNGEYLGVPEDDPYTQVQDQQPVQQASNFAPEVTGQKSLLSKLILPVGIGAIVLVGGFIGWTSLMSSTAPAPTVVADVPAVTQPQFPTALPSQETAQAPVTATPSVGTEVASNPPMKQTNEPQELSFDLPGTSPTDTATPVETPSLTDPVATSLPATTLPGSVVPATELSVPSPVGTVGQVKDTSPVAVQPAAGGNLPAAKDIALKSDLKDVLDRIASLEAKVDDLADSFSAKVDVPATPALPVTTVNNDVPAGSGLNSNALPVASIDNIEPPLKPIVIKGLTLVGVSGDTAWVNTGKDVISVKKSDALPNGGKVEDIRQYRGDWVLIATNGIVLR